MERRDITSDPPRTLQEVVLLWLRTAENESDLGLSDLIRQAARKAPGVPRIETACVARFGEFTAASVQRLFAEIALTRSQTLDDCFPLDTAAAADYLGELSKDFRREAEHPPAPPVKLLASWREILITLGMKNNREDKQKVSRLNKTYNGPIVIPGAGKQPIANKAKLIEWWNRVEIELQDAINQARGATADAESCHDYGRTGKAAPGVGGGVKRRRQDRKP